MLTRERLAQFIASLGVIASLGLVAWEVRQNTQAVVGQTLQALAEQHADLALLGVENVELRTAFDDAFTDEIDLRPDQRRQLSWYYTAVMRVTENRYRQYQLGNLNEDGLMQLGATGSLFRSPFFKEWWPANRDRFPEDVAGFVDANLLPLEVRPPPVR